MTDSSRCAEIQPYWFGKTEMEIRNAVDCRAERWAHVPGYSRYEWSDKGRVRVLPRTDDRGRHLAGKVLKTRPNNAGYEIVGVVSDAAGKQVTVAVAPMVVLAHHPAFRGLDGFPDGLETRHNPAMGDKLYNVYPEGLWPGTKKENAADKYGDEGPPIQFPCKNAQRCGNLVPREGRRCADCVAEVGRQAAALLNAGMNLQDAAEVFGYTRGDWTYKLAVRYGGYAGSKEQALAQRPPMGRRALLRFRRRSLLRQAASGGSDTL